MSKLKLTFGSLQNFWVRALLIFLSYVFLQITTWLPLRFWKIWGGGNFIDSTQVLHYADCYKTIGVAVYRSSTSDCSNYLYGRYLLGFINFLHLNASDGRLLGYSYMAFISIIFAWLSKDIKKSNLFSICLITFSPGVLLLVERGNFDSLILTILALASVQFARGNESFSIFLVLVTVLLKFYTLPLLVVLGFLGSKKTTYVTAFVGTLAGMYLTFRDILLIHSNLPHGSNAFFGLRIWGEYLTPYLPAHLLSICEIPASFLILGVVLIFVYVYGRPQWSAADGPREFSYSAQSVFVRISNMVLVFCFLAGLNFDYRLTFLAVGSIFEISALNTQKMRNWIAIGALWLSYPSGGLQPIGDLLLEIFICFVLLRECSLFSPKVQKLFQ